MPTRNVNLTGHYNQFVVELVTSGRFKNASEVMRAGLRLLERQNCEEAEKLALLRSLAREGFDQLDQGQGTVINGRRELREHIGRLGRHAAKKS